MNVLLRSASVLALAAAALAASAQVSYSFIGTNDNVTFTYVTSTYLTATRIVPVSDLRSSTGTFVSASLRPVDQFGANLSEIDVNTQAGTTIYVFAAGALGRNGLYTSTANSNVGTLTVSGSPMPTPEPSAFAALGLGAMAVLRRRKA